MKILWITDTHIRSRFKYGSEPDAQYGTIGLKRIALSLAWVLEQVREQKPDLFVFGGDLMDKSAMDFLSFGVAHDFFAGLAKLMHPDQIHIIRGNHDIHSNTIEWDHALYALKTYGVVHTHPRTIRTEAEGIVLRFVPYCDPTDLAEHVASLPAPLVKAGVCFAHVGLRDHIFADGRSFGPFEWEHFQSSRVYCGHYHIPSTYHAEKFVYTGALLPKDFSDAGVKPFGLTIIRATTADGIDYKVRHTTVSNPHAPTFLQVEEENITAKLSQRILAHAPNTYIEVKSPDPSGVMERLGKLPGIADRIVKITPVGDQVEVGTDAPSIDELTGEQNYFESSKLSQLLQEYCEANLVSRSDTNDYLSVGLTYLQSLSKSDVASKEGYEVISLSVEGFLSVGKVSLDLQQGIYVIEGINHDDGGSNGAGKSALTEALYYCLFGETIRAIPKLEQIVNSKIGHLRVSVVLRSRRSHQHVRVTRYRADPKHGNALLLHTSETGVVWYQQTKKKAADTEAAVASLLGITPALYKLTCLLSKHSTLLTHETESQRSEMFLDFLDIGFDAARESLAQACAEYKETLLNLNSAKVQFESVKQGELMSAKAVRDRLKTLLAKSSLEAIHSELQRAQRGLLQRQESLSIPLPTVDGSKDEIEAVQQSISELMTANTKRTTEQNIALQGLQDTINELEALEGHPTCPTCKQTLKDPELIASRLSNARASVHAIRASAKEAEMMYKHQRKQLDEALLAAKTALRTIEQGQANRHKLQAQADALRDQVIDLQKRAMDAEAEESRVKAEVAALEAKMVEVEAREWNGYAEMAAAERALTIATFWRKAFAKAGLPKYLLAKMLEVANTRLALYVKTLLHNTVSVQFRVGTKGVTLDCSRDYAELSYANLSDGQRACVDMAVQLALHDVAQFSFGGLDILVVDEAVAYLDESKSDRVIALLRAKLTAGSIKSIFFVSHREHDFKGADIRTIRATLSNGVTSYTFH